MEALVICIQSSHPSKRESTRESTEMTHDKDYIADKGQARDNDVTSNQMTGKMGTRQTSIRCNKKKYNIRKSCKKTGNIIQATSSDDLCTTFLNVFKENEMAWKNEDTYQIFSLRN